MKSERAHASPRTCVGCKAEASRDALVRFVFSEEPPFIAPDITARMPGRGVSVHPTRACIRAALKQGGFAKALRKPVKTSEEALALALASRYTQRALSLLGAARRNRTLALGADGTREALALGRALLVVLADDAAGSRSEIIREADARAVPTLSFSSKAALGAVLGRGDVGVVALTDPSLAGEAHRAIARSIALSEVE